MEIREAIGKRVSSTLEAPYPMKTMRASARSAWLLASIVVVAVAGCRTPGARTAAIPYRPALNVDVVGPRVHITLAYSGASACRLSLAWRGTEEGALSARAPSTIERTSDGSVARVSMVFNEEIVLASDAVVLIDGVVDCEDGGRTPVDGDTVAGPEGWKQICREQAPAAPPVLPQDAFDSTDGVELELRPGRLPRLTDGNVLADGHSSEGRRLVDLCTGSVLVDLSGTAFAVRVFGKAPFSQNVLSPDERVYLLSLRGVTTRYAGLKVDVVLVDPSKSWSRDWPQLRTILKDNPSFARAFLQRTEE